METFKKIVVIERQNQNIFNEQKVDLAAFFQNDQWLTKLCYLRNIFEKLTNLNLSFQGRHCNIFSSNAKI